MAEDSGFRSLDGIGSGFSTPGGATGSGVRPTTSSRILEPALAAFDSAVGAAGAAGVLDALQIGTYTTNFGLLHSGGASAPGFARRSSPAIPVAQSYSNTLVIGNSGSRLLGGFDLDGSLDVEQTGRQPPLLARCSIGTARSAATIPRPPLAPAGSPASMSAPPAKPAKVPEFFD